MSANIDNRYPDEIIMNRWMEPIESFTSDPKSAQPIMYSSAKSFDLSLSKIQNSDDSVILAHETDLDSAENIFRNGFKKKSAGMSPLRDNAVFGWIFDKDIGKHAEYSDSESNAVVLFEAPEEKVYVSSYSSSAYLLAMGLIDETQYERNYVMDYSSFISIVKSDPMTFQHLNYNIDRFL